MVLVLASLMIVFVMAVFAEMFSTNYRIPTTVISGSVGPIAMFSTNFQMNSTLGQPSPLMDSLDPPYSASYDLYPDYWYTLISLIPEVCEGDFNADRDVDGSDLAGYRLRAR